MSARRQQRHVVILSLIISTSPPWLTQPVHPHYQPVQRPPCFALQTYEPLAHTVLRRCLLYDIIPPSALPVWASTVLWKMWSSGGVFSLSISDTLAMPFLPSTLLMTTLFWAFGVLPIILLRKSHLTGKHVSIVSLTPRSYPCTAVSTPSSSPSQRFIRREPP